MERYTVTLGAFGFQVIDTQTGNAMPGDGSRLFNGVLPVFAARHKAQATADALNREETP